MGAKQGKPASGQKAMTHKTLGITKAQYYSLSSDWNNMAVNGKLTRQRMIDVAVSSGLYDAETAGTAFDVFDMDGSGEVDVEEFMTMAALSINGDLKTKLKAAFRVFDANKDGILTKDELRVRLRKAAHHGGIITEEQSKAIDAKVDAVLDEVFTLMDKDKSGGIDINEYVDGLSQNQQVIKFIHDLA